jgi:nucleoside-diphosphate-sugar epimerase
MKVLVTGSSSHLARALLPLLCAQEQISGVTGVDIAAPHFKHEKFHAERCDIRDSRLASLYAEHDALVHLAFVVLRGRMRESEMASINVDGSSRVLRAARDAGIARLIHLSSAAVYGEGDSVTEDAACAPLPGFLYGEHKARLESLLAAEVPECVRLRPHVILGPNAQPLLRTLLNLPLYVALPPQLATARLQCVHENDVAQAILLALECDVRGPFNLAAADTFGYREFIQSRHRHALGLSQGLARTGLHAAWRLAGWGGEPTWVDGLARTLTLDCSRAARELGWQCRHGSAATLAGIAT